MLFLKSKQCLTSSHIFDILVFSSSGRSMFSIFSCVCFLFDCWVFKKMFPWFFKYVDFLYFSLFSSLSQCAHMQIHHNIPSSTHMCVHTHSYSPCFVKVPWKFSTNLIAINVYCPFSQ